MAPGRSSLPGGFRRGPREFFSAQPLVRLEFLRIFLPLAILGFLSYRLVHAPEWLTEAGFQVPDLGRKDWRQPLYLAPLPPWSAWLLAAITVVSGLGLSIGFKTKPSALVFCLCMAYLALADRLAAFTVNKLGTVLVLALFLVPCGKLCSVDAWLAGTPRERPEPGGKVSWGNVRFFQCLLVVMYCASGISKWNGDWLSHPHVLWTHMHDSYQTAVTYWVADALPATAWRPLQYAVLAFEILAPLWFLVPFLRLPALGFGLGMHLIIGLCFGPVKWFALLMAILLLGSFAPPSWLNRFFARLGVRQSDPAGGVLPAPDGSIRSPLHPSRQH